MERKWTRLSREPAKLDLLLRERPNKEKKIGTGMQLASQRFGLASLPAPCPSFYAAMVRTVGIQPNQGFALASTDAADPGVNVPCPTHWHKPCVFPSHAPLLASWWVREVLWRNKGCKVGM